jgi:hypothetical protein
VDELGKEKGDDSGYEDYDDEDSHDADDLSILRYGTQEEECSLSAYDELLLEATSTQFEAALYGAPSMEGIWTGLNLYDGQTSTDGLTQVVIHETSDGSFHGGGLDGLGTFILSGHIKHNAAHNPKVKILKQFNGLQYGTKTTWKYKGELDIATRIIAGRWRVEAPRKHVGDFYLRRSPAFSYQFKCSPEQIAANPARARWLFAWRAVRHQVRQRLWSWSYFNHRRIHRKRFLDLFKRRELTSIWHLPADQLTKEEDAELLVLERSLSPLDGRFYHSLGKAQNRILCIHL